MTNNTSGRTLVLLLFSGFCLLMLNLYEPSRVFKEAYLRIILPVTGIIEYTPGELGRIKARSRLALDLASEADRLRKEADSLRVKQADYEYLRNRYKHLSSEAGVIPGLSGDFIKARIIIKSPEDYFTRLIVARGSADGVRRDAAAAVLGESGWVLAGRVDEVYDNFSSIILVTSNEFRAAAQFLSGARGVVRGTGGWDIIMEYISPETRVNEGDPVYTDGGGGIFPEGLLVGNVVNLRTLEFSRGKEARLRSVFYPQDAFELYIFR